MCILYKVNQPCNAGMVVPKEQVDLPERNQSGPVFKGHADGSTGRMPCTYVIYCTSTCIMG